MGLRMLKVKRMMMGVTQVDIAKKLGINVKSYNFKENGRSKFTLKELIKMTEIFSLTEEEVKEIFFEHEITEVTRKD
ncbi:MAG: helix-turn-helix transcriptional regulator [Peptostreptococcaceae bacterium]